MNVLIGVDFSDGSETMLENAKALAQTVSARVWLLHVAAPEPDFIGFEPGPQSVRNARAGEYHAEHRQIQEIADDFVAAGLDATALLIQGPTVKTILKEADKLDADMIVVGSHGHSELYQLLLGSVSEGVLHGAKCPVLTVPTRPKA